MLYQFAIITSGCQLFVVLNQPILAVVKKHSPVTSTHKAVSAAIITQRNNGLTALQKATAKAALKSLRRLGAATEVGVSSTDYQSRLIDTKADVDEDLRSLPDGKLKSNIVGAMQAYVDASTFWNECSQLVYRDDILNGASGSILAKYNLTLPLHGKREDDAYAKADAENKEENAQYDSIKDDPNQVDLQEQILAKQKRIAQDMSDNMFAALKINDEDETGLLAAIWKVANQKEKNAEDSLKQP